MFIGTLDIVHCQMGGSFRQIWALVVQLFRHSNITIYFHWVYFINEGYTIVLTQSFLIKRLIICAVKWAGVARYDTQLWRFRSLLKENTGVSAWL